MDVQSYQLLESSLLVAAALVATYIVYRRTRLILQLRNFNGPLICKISEIPHIRAFLSEKCHHWYENNSRKYGPLVVVSPGILSTSSPDLWTHMNTAPGYKKSKWFYRAARFDWRDDNVFTEVDKQKHDQRRKQMIPGYSGRENLTLESDIDTSMFQLIHLIRSNYAQPKRPMDLAQKLQFLTLDVISTIGFGKCLGLLDADSDPDEYVKSTHAGLQVNNRQMALGTWWLNWIPFVGPKADPDIETALGFDKILALSSAMVDARERAFRAEKSSGLVERADMLTSFMSNGLSGTELKTEVVLQIVAGSDTTAGGLRGILLYLLGNPRVYKILQAEIDDAVRSGIAPHAPDIITYAQAQKLPYLQATIREANRVFPPLNNPFSRDVPSGGDTVTIDGEQVYLPGGICVVPSFKAMHRDRNLYGEDVDVFRPERWIEETDKKKLEAMRHENDGMFGYGRYQCLGKGIAMMETSKVIFELLRNFDWGLLDPENPWKIANLMGLRSISDMWVQVEERP